MVRKKKSFLLLLLPPLNPKSSSSLQRTAAISNSDKEWRTIATSLIGQSPRKKKDRLGYVASSSSSPCFIPHDASLSLSLFSLLLFKSIISSFFICPLRALCLRSRTLTFGITYVCQSLRDPCLSGKVFLFSSFLTWSRTVSHPFS